MKNGNGSWGRALSVGTGIAAVLAAGITLGMCPKMSEIQTTIEAKVEHDEIEDRLTKTAEREHDRIDAVLVNHKQTFEQHRTELNEYRKGQQENRELIHETQKQILRELRRGRD